MEDEEQRGLGRIAEGDPPEPENLLEQFAQKRETVASNRETNIPVPGYDREPPILLIRYRVMSSKELKLIGQTVARTTPKDETLRQQLVTADIFCNAATGFFFDLGDGVPKPLRSADGEPITGFTRELAEGLRYADKIADPDNQRDVCFGLFAGNDVMMEKHNFQLSRWMGDTSINIAREMMEGNS